MFIYIYIYPPNTGFSPFRARGGVRVNRAQIQSTHVDQETLTVGKLQIPATQHGYFFGGGVPSSCVDCSTSIELSSGSPTVSAGEVCVDFLDLRIENVSSPLENIGSSAVANLRDMILPIWIFLPIVK